jgi:hypothetical protein
MWVDRNHYLELAILKIYIFLIIINRKYLGVIVINQFIIICFCNFLNYFFYNLFFKIFIWILYLNVNRCYYSHIKHISNPNPVKLSWLRIIGLFYFIY